jgi:ribosomal protein S12 methylthiotransferase accessory factor
VHERRLQFIRLSGDRAVIRDGARQVSVNTSAAMTLVEQVVERLNRGDPPERIVAAFPASDRGGATTLLEALDAGAVPHRQHPPTPPRPAPGRTVVHGVNAISTAAVLALLDLGLDDVVVVRDPVLDDGRSGAAPDDPDPAGRHAAGVAILAGADDVVLSAADVVLATCDYGRADRLQELSRAACAAGAVMVPAWLDGFTGHVGPITVPGAGACLRCYALRRAANDERPELSDALRRHATESPEGRGATGFVEPMTGVLGALCGLEIQRLHDPRTSPAAVGRSLEIDLVRCQATARPVLAVPGCPDCAEGGQARPGPAAAGEAGGADRARDADRTRLARLLGGWDRLVDRKVGIVKEVTPLPIDEDEPDFVHYLSTACSTDRLTRLRNFGNNGGVGVDHHGAVAKAIGEAVERYCSAFFRYADLHVASYRELPGPGTHPDAFALYRPEQLAAGDVPWRPFTVDAPVSWTTGTSLCTGERVFVPAAMVFVPFHYLRDGRDTPIGQPISTGLAAGCSFADAALSGLCEAIERDAFTITWQARLSRPRVPLATLPPACRDREERFAQAGLRVEIMDITTDLGVPTVLTVALGDRPTSPAVAVAAATHPQPEVAINKSLEELAHTRKFARQVMDYTPPLPVDAAAEHPEVVDQKHHLRFYCPQPARRFAAFAWAAEEERPFSAMTPVLPDPDGGQLVAVVAKVRAAGLDVISCDLTTPDIAELGLAVVRVVVPGLHPLFMGHRNRALGGRRLYEVPQRLGLRGIAPGEADNPYPHPFP